MYMEVITSTELRTKMPEVIATLSGGGKIALVHRSKIIAEITPKVTNARIISARELQKKIDALDCPRLTKREIERRYRAAMMKKHGQGLS